MHCTKIHIIRFTLAVLRNSYDCLQKSLNYLKHGFKKALEIYLKDFSPFKCDDFTSSQMGPTRVEIWEQWVFVSVYTDPFLFLIWRKGISSWLQCHFKYYIKPLMESKNLKSRSCLEKWIIQVICNFTKPQVDVSYFAFTICSTVPYTQRFGC